MNTNKDETTKSRTFTLRINPDVLKRIEQVAQAEDRTTAGQIMHYIRQGLERKA
jgi:hypothetical protein